MRFQLPSVASASTIMIATSSLPAASVTTRPATMRSKTASSSCLAVGNATHWSACSPWPGMSARRTPAIGPENGRPEICVDSRRGVDRERVVELARRDREDRDDDLDLVAEAVDERRAQRTVDETADEDRLGRGAAFATEERAGDLAGGVRALFDVDGQREEVEAFTRVLAGARGREEHRLLVEVRGDGALRLLRETAGLEPDRAGAEASVVEDGFGECDFRTFQEVSPFLSREQRRPVWAVGAKPLLRLAHPCGARACVKGAGTGSYRRADVCREYRLRWPPVESHHLCRIADGNPPQGTSFLPACSMSSY